MVKIINLKYSRIIDKSYRQHFSLIVNEEPDKFYKWLLKFHKDAKDDKVEKLIMDCKGITLWHLTPYHYVYIKKFDWTIDDQAVLVHELNHVVDFVFNALDVPFRCENTEVRAYYFEYLFTECYSILKKLHPKIIKKYGNKNKKNKK